MEVAMRTGWIAAAVFGVALTAAGAQSPDVDNPSTIKVQIKDSKGENVGFATFKTVKKGVQVKISLKNMPVGVHGVHIHQDPMCDGPDFKTAGPHFNPDGKMHGYDNPEGHHNGDFPKNIEVGEGKTGTATFVISTISLDRSSPNSLFTAGGTSIVVHEKADDMKTDPSGNSGNRIACGVIQ
jgi:Cu-Zn family superoxide dismutase